MIKKSLISFLWLVIASNALAVQPAPYKQRLLQDEIIYFVLVDRFNNGDNSNDHGAPEGSLSHGCYYPDDIRAYHGGDLQGLIDKLDYIKALGATAVWLTPIWTNRAIQPEACGYHGYWILDFMNVDPHLGDNNKLKELIDTAHEKNIKIYFDVIANHTADIIEYKEKKDDIYSTTPYTPVVRDAWKDVKNPKWLNDPKYYHNRGNTTWYGESAILGDFSYLDDLATSDPFVIKGFEDIFRFYVQQFKPDGFRVDTVKHVHMELWDKAIPAAMDEAKKQGVSNFTAFAEIYENFADRVAKYTTTGEFPSALDFGHQWNIRDVFSAGLETSRLATVLGKDDVYIDEDSDAYSLVTFIDNHDMGRFGYFIDKDKRYNTEEERQKILELAYGYLFFTRGAPVIYYGDEQGFVGDGHDIWARQDMMPSQVESFNDDDLIGTDATTADDNFNTSHPIFKTIQQFSSVRHGHKALRQGVQIVRNTTDSAGLFAFSRYMEDDRREYVVALNTSLSPIAVSVSSGTPASAFDRVFPEGIEQTVSDDTGVFKTTIPPLGIKVFKAQKRIKVATNLHESKFESPEKGLSVSNKMQVVLDTDFNGVAKVDFYFKFGNGRFKYAGTDHQAPYRLYWDSSKIMKKTPLVIKAVFNNLDGLTHQLLHAVAVDPSAVHEAKVTYQNKNKRRQLSVLTSTGQIVPRLALPTNDALIPFSEKDKNITLFYEDQVDDSFDLDKPIVARRAELIKYVSDRVPHKASLDLMVNNNGDWGDDVDDFARAPKLTTPKNSRFEGKSVRLFLNGKATSSEMEYVGNGVLKTQAFLNVKNYTYAFFANGNKKVPLSYVETETPVFQPAEAGFYNIYLIERMLGGEPVIIPRMNIYVDTAYEPEEEIFNNLEGTYKGDSYSVMVRRVGANIEVTGPMNQKLLYYLTDDDFFASESGLVLEVEYDDNESATALHITGVGSFSKE